MPYNMCANKPEQKPMIRTIFLLISCLILISCAPRNNFAPIVERGNKIYIYHTVKRGETLRNIATQYRRDYRQIATLNKLRAPYKIHAGQKLLIVESRSKKSKTTTFQKTPQRMTTDTTGAETGASTRAASEHGGVAQRSSPTALTSPITPIKKWLRPVSGKIINPYGGKNKGIDFQGKKGDSVIAVADGKVMYSGNSLPGYGNLLIIQHDNTYLSTYAHNNQLLVKEGTRVKAGQKIATMGDTGTDKVMLHFEIRQRGKPVNPLNFIPG